MRYLFSGLNKCPSNCKYCFAKWENKYYSMPQFNINTINDNLSDKLVLYPCCDSDFFAQSDAENIMNNLLTINKKVYISISTKNSISNSSLDKIQKLDRYLRINNLGFVKISISFSTKYRIDEIEQNTLSYSERLKLLKLLTDKKIFTSIIFKPILPFIPVNEYLEIIDDCANIIDKIVIGGLYINKTTEFYKEYIKNRYQTETHPVNWLSEITVWDYFEDKNKNNMIRDYAKTKSIKVFDSDIELIKSISNEKEE